jgi:hypothetical protein
MKNLENAIQAVEDDNSVNNGSWNSWENANQIANVYELNLDNEDAAYLNKFISLDHCPLNKAGQCNFNVDGSFWKELNEL